MASWYGVRLGVYDFDLSRLPINFTNISMSFFVVLRGWSSTLLGKMEGKDSRDLTLAEADPEMFALVKEEKARQFHGLELIASEVF